MKNKLLFALTTVTLAYGHTQAQVSNYSFTQTVGSYGTANTGSLVGPSFQDDDVTPVTLPFTFMYNGTGYTSINVCANGYLSFNSISGTEYMPISDNTTQNLIAPMGNDLLMGTVINGDITAGSKTITNCSSVTGYSVGDVIVDYNNDFGSVNPTVTAVSGNSIVVNITATGSDMNFDIINGSGYIKQSVSGVSPNRICEFEFAGFSRFFVYDEVMHFKVKLYETSNKIEFVYGSSISGVDSTPAEVGLKGNSTSDFNSRKVLAPNAWSTSLASGNITDNCDFSPLLVPANGLSYLWTPPSCITPTLSITQSNAQICAGTSVTLTANGAASYTWTNGPATQQSVVSPTTTTIYTLTGANGLCAGTATIMQIVQPNPAVTVAQSRSVTCTGESVTLTPAGASSYSWSSGSTAPQMIIQPTVTVTYTVTGTTASCSGTTSVVQTVASCNGLAKNDQGTSGLSVFPNPFIGTLNIAAEDAKKVSVIIRDALGKTVYTADSDKVIDTGFLHSGVYFITLTTTGGSITKKIVKE